jgi:hypothetical protein
MFTNDTFQGREDTRFIPISDQWGLSPDLPMNAQTAHKHSFKYDVPEAPEVHVKKSHRPENYHRKNVLTDSNGRGVSTELVEDIFHSWEGWSDTHPNPHNARWNKETGKYNFDYPASWLNAGTVARAVALRSIQVIPAAISFSMRLMFKSDDGPPLPATQVEIFLDIPEKYSIDQALSAICKTVNKVIPKGFPSKLCYAWDSETMVASLFLRNNNGDPPTGEMDILEVGEGFSRLFNVPSDDRMDELLEDTQSWSFPDVWDRKNILVHASFVTNSSFHYLGTNGEFYTSPSKIYYQNFTGNDFEVFLSVNGVTPLALYYQEFSIELSFIVDRKHYQD